MHLQNLFTHTKKMGRETEQLGETKIRKKIACFLPYSLKESIFAVSEPLPILSGIEKHPRTATVERLWGLIGCSSLILIYQWRKRTRKTDRKDYSNTESPETRVQCDLFVCDQTKSVLIWSTATTVDTIWIYIQLKCLLK